MRAFISVTMLALASTQASADFEVLKKERGWVIGVNSAERTCTAFSAQNHQGTRLAFIWALEDANWAVNAGAKLGQRPGVKVGHRRFEHDKARKPLREGAFVLLPLV